MAASRGPLLLLFGIGIGLSLALALLLGAASSSASPTIAAASPSVAAESGSSAAFPSVAAASGSSATSTSVAAASSSSAASRHLGVLKRTSLSVLALPASPVRRHVIDLALAPAGRRLFAYPAEYLEPHGAGDPAAAAAPAAPETINSAEVRDITVEATVVPDYGWGSLSDSPLQPGAAALLQPTSETILATPASPANRPVLALAAETPGPHAADGPAAAPAPAAPPAGDHAGREVPVPPRATTCTFVTYIGGAAETVQRGDGRVFVVREFTGTGATNASAATEGADAMDYESPSDSDEDAHDSGEDSFSSNMEEFCAYVSFVSDVFDIIKPFI